MLPFWPVAFTLRMRTEGEVEGAGVWALQETLRKTTQISPKL